MCYNLYLHSGNSDIYVGNFTYVNSLFNAPSISECSKTSGEAEFFEALAGLFVKKSLFPALNLSVVSNFVILKNSSLLLVVI